MKRWIRKIVPKPALFAYHFFLAFFGALLYGFPSRKLIVIGVTGTSGKSSTIFFLKQIFEQMGKRVCTLSTIEFSLPSQTRLNDKKMTMLGRFFIQKFLRQALRERCEVALIETTSEGVVQHRHRFINYDIAVLTNLYPEHIESHGGFENYKNAKKTFFEYAASLPHKKINGAAVQKGSVVNAAVPQADEFLDIAFDRRALFARNDEELFVEFARLADAELILGKDVFEDARGVHFDVNRRHADMPIYGEHNVSNVLAGMAVCRLLGIKTKTIVPLLAHIAPPPGRIERIPEADPFGFTAIVDYAFEPVAMKALYDTVASWNPKRIIHVFGGTGGGRDVARRFTVGKLAGEAADICVITNEDPYNDDPRQIIWDVAGAVEQTGKVRGENLFEILDREEAIQKAVAMAETGDVILVTGKGSEQGMVVGGAIVPWDDREMVRKALEKR